MLRKCLLAVSLICGLLWSASAQTGVTVTGTVVDEGAVPMPGVVIVVKNNPSGGHAITDANGNFTINVAKGSTLVASYMGFITEEKKFETAGDWLVTLREDTTQLEEVVVVGYGVQKKESVVGSITQVNGISRLEAGCRAEFAFRICEIQSHNFYSRHIKLRCDQADSNCSKAVGSPVAADNGRTNLRLESHIDRSTFTKPRIDKFLCVAELLLATGEGHYCSHRKNQMSEIFLHNVVF